MSTRRVLYWLAGMARVAALVGCLVSGILPLGQLPKIAGPCGRELCECAPVPQQSPCDRSDCPWRAPEAQIVFDGPVFHPAIPSTILLTVIFDLHVPQMIKPAAQNALEQDLEYLQSKSFALTVPSHDIPTPPPRA